MVSGRSLQSMSTLSHRHAPTWPNSPLSTCGSSHLHAVPPDIPNVGSQVLQAQGGSAWWPLWVALHLDGGPRGVHYDSIFALGLIPRRGKLSPEESRTIFKTKCLQPPSKSREQKGPGPASGQKSSQMSMGSAFTVLT